MNNIMYKRDGKYSIYLKVISMFPAHIRLTDHHHKSLYIYVEYNKYKHNMKWNGLAIYIYIKVHFIEFSFHFSHISTFHDNNNNNNQK